MKNSDLPATPQDSGIWCDGIGLCPTEATGLTKREIFAMHAMHGLLSSGKFCSIDIAKHSLVYADKLLKELEK